MAHGIVIRTDHLQFVTDRQQPIKNLGWKSVFYSNICDLTTPGPTQKPTRGADSLPNTLPIPFITGKNHRLGLWLSVPAHAPIGHNTAVGQMRKRRLNCVKRTPEGLQTVVVPRIQ